MNNKDFTLKDKYTLGVESSDECSSYAHITNENINNEVEASDISLKSFDVQNKLAEKLWDGRELDSRVRLELLQIANDFWESVHLSWVKPKGLILTGSICNYNWSKYSDIDLHLIVDFKEIHERVDFVQEYFDEKKNSWNNEHEYLTIYGFPVELYVQDINAEVESGGIYDLNKARWIQQPKSGDIKPIKDKDKGKIKLASAKIMTKIDELCDEFYNTDDDWEKEQIGKEVEKLLKDIKHKRKVGLKDGEMGEGNIIYKVLRRSGYLEKLWNLSTRVYDDVNSIDESLLNDLKKQLF